MRELIIRNNLIFEMMIYISLILFLISKGSIKLHRLKNQDALIEGTTNGKIILLAISLVQFALIFKTINDITRLNFFWIFIITIGTEVILSKPLADLYSSILGYKSKPTISYMEGGFVKHNLHLVDALITFIIGLIFYFLT